MSMQNQQDLPEDMAFPHFALIYIDREGNLRQESSLSIANSRETILSPRVTDEFLRAVARSRGAAPSHSPCKCHIPRSAVMTGGRDADSPVVELGAPPIPHQITSGQTPIPIQTQTGHARPSVDRRALEGDAQIPVTPTLAPSMQPTMWSAPQGPGPWPRWSGQNQRSTQQRGLGDGKPNMRSNQKAFISVRDSEFLRRYYEKIFQNLQQTNCRVLAKAYVKLVEPRKQVNFPYNGRKIISGKTQQLEPDETKPPWWPTGVSHREPDHLPKSERIRLLVHILCELRTSYGITAQRLKAADQPIRRQILPVERLEILDEVYQVREEEEKFLEGITDGKTMVSISRSNLPDAAEALVNRGERIQSPKSIEENPSPEPKTETPFIRSGPTRANPPQPIFVPGGDVVSNPQPTPSPSRQIHQDLPIHPGYDHTRVSIPPQVKRKRQDSELDASTALSPNAVGYYSPIFVGSQPFLTGSCDDAQGFPPSNILPGHPIPEPFREPMEQCEFPYYFDS
ncbi:hypothetical protein N7532_012062 [Penicillium argentinense]|uniref:Subtelomeric hrmA-associated cluster protein AFUB-079030/YDR124W-like helical bundle domain-containing protein n=1 Tax=Penicillium argentinense TaxID=1131581 RepID=A0A9W9EJS3_9EURO|nr:uncharacterized protein N7532_012062 [Penicillium argentinense]KAJ5083019.1 hypothetical protein N7532_012062 [Penicillium argentinense]